MMNHLIPLDEHTSTDLDGGPEAVSSAITKNFEKPPKPVNVMQSSIDPRYSFLVMGYVYNLDCKEEVSLKILAKSLLAAPPVKHGLFSPDGQWVALVSPNHAIYTFRSETGKHMWTFGADEKAKGFSSFDNESNHLRGRVHILPNNLLLCPGSSGHANELYVYDLKDGTTRAMFSDQDYDISLVTVSSSTQLVATANSSSVIVSGHPKGKPVVVYNTQTLSKLATCYGVDKETHWVTVGLCGSAEQYLCAAQWRAANVVLYYIGDNGLYDGVGLPVHVIVGHTQDVCFIRESPMGGGVLLTASMDNTVKVWSMERIMSSCQQQFDECCKGNEPKEVVQKFFCEERERPHQSGEGPIETTAMAVCK